MSPDFLKTCNSDHGCRRSLSFWDMVAMLSLSLSPKDKNQKLALVVEMKVEITGKGICSDSYKGGGKFYVQ